MEMVVDWNVIVGEILTQILRIVIPVCIALVLKWAAELYHRIKTDQPDWTPVLEWAAKTAVLAAEQIFGSGHGDEKKKYALDTIQRIMAESGIKLDVYVISDAIEAAVCEYFHHDEEPEEDHADDHS